jgi:hypothetical protein
MCQIFDGKDKYLDLRKKLPQNVGRQTKISELKIQKWPDLPRGPDNFDGGLKN